MHIDDNGVLANVRFIASPHCDYRSNIANIRLIVIHNISLPPGKFGGSGVLDLFTGKLDPANHPYYAQIHKLRVSAHFFVRRDGEIIQFVPCVKRAWHCGVSAWCGWERCNDFSIGIELEGDDYSAFTEVQYRQLQALISSLRTAYGELALAGHSAIAPDRKTDPGPYFDWAQVEASSSA
ncbi:MAG: 1,6-anhydro-N-acetylmuramyl-L-alanine amidase AmpD [Sulfuriferula sp.]